MKKLFTMMALLVAFVSTGFAQSYYVVGNLTSWTYQPSNDGIAPMALLDGTTDSYYADFAPTGGGTMYFCIADGNGTSWDDFNGNHRYSASEEDYSVSDGVENLQLGKYGDRCLTLAADGSNYRIIFNASNNQLTVIKSGAAQNAEITQVDIRGEFNGWSYSEDYQFVKGEGEIYTLSLDLSSDMEDKAFKLVVNNSDWLGYGSMTIDAPEGWIDVAEGNDYNYLLKHSVTGYKTYTLTATWLPNSSATSGWTLKIEGAEPRVAEITSVQIFGSWSNWDSNFPVDLLASESNTYVGGIPIPTAKAEEFKLVVNGTWLGYNQVTLAGEYDFVSEGSNNNFKVSEAYMSYDITATWTPGPDASAGWTLAIAPGAPRPKTTFTATFVNGAGWENVYAYIWKVEGVNNVELNGPFPGVQLEKTGTTTINTVEYDVYIFTFETYEDESTVPEMIIFSDGTDTNKTEDLEFVNEKKYTETVPANAEITSVHMHQDGNTSYEITANTPNVYTTTIGLWATLEDYVFELIVNPNNDPNTKLVHFSDIAIDPATPEGWLVEGSNGMIVLKNSISGYGIYNLTATWTPSPDASKGWTLKVEGVTPRPNADINSVKVVVPNAPVDPFDITNKKEEVDGNYVYSMDMDLSVVTTDVPFNFVINGKTLPVANITLDPSVDNLLDIVTVGPYSSVVLRNAGSGYAVYTATATWTPNPNAMANWTMKVVGKEPRPSGTTYSIIYNLTNQANDWKVGDTMTGTEGVFTTTFNNKPGMRFAIAPTGSIGINGIQWNQIIRPKVTSGDFEINYFSNYSDETEVVESGGKVWWIMDDNASGLTLTFNPADNKFTIVSDATTTASISTAGYATYSMSKPFTVEGAEVYIVTGVASGEANMVRLEGANLEIPAGTGVILKGEAGDYTVKPSFGEGSVAGNLLIGTGESPNGYDITGVYPQEMGGGEYTAYIFANKEPNGVGFYLLDSSNGNTIAPFKAFLAVPKSQTAPDFIGFGDTTGIDATLNDNGQMINDNIIYDLSGRRVMNPTKGLYIINGKKVVIK